MISSCQIFSAPLQGVTNHSWRQAHSTIFGGVNAYCSPFMRIIHGKIPKRDINDTKPENNQGVTLIPQILACKPQDATTMALHLKQAGYTSININLGCPFPPIALKHNGSGMLPFPQEVENLFNALKSIPGLSYSVKMRLGWQDPNDWRAIWPLFDLLEPQFIAIHPCTGKDQYKGNLMLDIFNEMLSSTSFPIIYNGNIQDSDDIKHVISKWPSLHGVMIGRALAGDPAMLCPDKATPDNYRRFHLEIYNHYTSTLTGGSHQVLTTMQAFWQWFLPLVPHKCRKAIKKANSIEKYETAVNALFNEL